MERHDKTMMRCQTTQHGMKLTRHGITGHHDMVQEALTKGNIPLDDIT